MPRNRRNTRRIKLKEFLNLRTFLTIVGILLMSEFIGTSSTLGTAQTAYECGIWASWNLISLGIGFLLYSRFIAAKIQSSGEYTISGILSKTYGKKIN